MAEKVRSVEYYYATIPDEPGTGSKVLAQLQQAGVNLLACLAFPSEKGSDCPASPSAATNQAKPMKIITWPRRLSGRWRRATRPLPTYAEPTNSVSSAQAAGHDSCSLVATTTAAPSPEARATRAMGRSRLIN